MDGNSSMLLLKPVKLCHTQSGVRERRLLYSIDFQSLSAVSVRVYSKKRRKVRLINNHVFFHCEDQGECFLASVRLAFAPLFLLQQKIRSERKKIRLPEMVRESDRKCHFLFSPFSRSYNQLRIAYAEKRCKTPSNFLHSL